jgi:CRP/FNR family nitrogen fixation transcriptional regulator
MDGRLTATGIVALPMNRRDIADYLGITLETVSRALSLLQQAGVLKFIGPNHREIVLRDRIRLASFDLAA